jgi:undecaprenyl diphosphate synthase
MDKSQLLKDIDKTKIPKHIALVVDGNGRWAKEKNRSRSYGHRKGAETLEKIVRFAHEIGVKIVSVYAFSTENWKRDKKEVDYLFNLFYKTTQRFLHEESNFNQGVRFVHMGRKDNLPKKLTQALVSLEEKSKHNEDFIINIGINYGGRDEILRAVNKALKNEKKELTQSEFENYLDTSALSFPNPDLVIRTSGEMRLSNFMLYQMAYSEFTFPQKYWPAFEDKDLIEAIKEYQTRKRRFGKA